MIRTYKSSNGNKISFDLYDGISGVYSSGTSITVVTKTSIFLSFLCHDQKECGEICDQIIKDWEEGQIQSGPKEASKS